ncbi:hypothetical protein GOP47_0013149 [Adiantum capillus-veneris]|uniref:Pentatricopeptide repeat-containing protein n=1 Tax=Adiantum capillus-veneris TaxID=13818 RepID=A0A9D4ZCW6_ADICA|nr:hypothetical protein GOP47_0013149 [Adiantum capillus-veneris]
MYQHYKKDFMAFTRQMVMILGGSQGYAQQEDGITAFGLFKRMQQENIKADKVTILGALKCCASVGAVLQAMQLHHNVCHDGLEADMLLGSSLVDVYAKLVCLKEAGVVFSGLQSLDVVSCSAMISGYVQQGLWFQSINLYDLMVQKNIKPDNISFACVLKACCQIGVINDCKLLHDQIIRVDLNSDVLVGNALVDMYAKCGRLPEARYVFNTLPARTLASWNTIMTGYADNDDGFQVFELFELLQRKGLVANRVSYLSVLKASSSLGSIVHGFFIHDQIVRNSLEADLVVSNMMVDTYARCGGLKEARAVFGSLPNRNVVSWSALIAGYAQHRGLESAQHYLHGMLQSGVNPVSKTFTSILGACSNGGQVEDGHYYFRLMREEYGIAPSIEHCNCMIDILGRAGCLEDGQKFLHSMPILPNIATWMSLLTSCRTFGDIEFGRLCFKQANKLNPYNSSAYMIMSKIYADANMWTEVRKLEEARKQGFAWKKPGKAFIEVSGKVYQFTAGEKNLQWASGICAKPQFLVRMLKEKGYVPASDSVLETEVEVVACCS